MKKLIFLIPLLFLLGCASEKQVCFESNCFEVETSDNPLERTQGLMFRSSLDENKGMLFIFESSGLYSFWMKNTLIPLDIIWINENLEIIDIQRDAQPCTSEVCKSYSLSSEALYVLEINSGLTEKYGMNIGDKVEIR